MTDVLYSVDFRINPLGFVANTLTNYEATAILREQVQNADDACHVQGRAGRLSVRFEHDRLVFENSSVMLDRDWDSLLEPASRGKFGDAEQNGEFGVGFWSALHLTDAPVIVSQDRRCRADISRRLDIERNPAPLDGTRFEFPYRTGVTEVSRKLDVGPVTRERRREMEASFRSQLPGLLLFTRALDRIELAGERGGRYLATRAIRGRCDQVDEVCITTTGPRGAAERRLLIITGQHQLRMSSRRSQIHVAFPLDAEVPEPGKVFCAFPTETPTGTAFSIDGHFHAAQDRRSITNYGDYQHWNDEIFRAAGELAGRLLPQILEIVPDKLAALRWFVEQRDNTDAVTRRGRLCLDAVDAEARRLAVVPDRNGQLHRGEQLVLLDADVEPILGGCVSSSVSPPGDSRLTSLLLRWGVRRWGPAEVAAWLADNAPPPGTPLDQAPSFLRDVDDLVDLLNYCEPVSGLLQDAALSLGTDRRLHPLGSPDLPRPTRGIHHLSEGLALPLLDERLQGTAAWSQAVPMDARWLRDALAASVDQVAGKTVPLASVGCLRQLTRVHEVAELLRAANLSLEGVPLAVDDQRKIGVFDASVVVGLPGGRLRPEVAQLVRHLGLTPLHKDIDTPDLAAVGGTPWTLELLTDLVEQDVRGRRWAPAQQGARLAATVWAMNEERRLEPAAIGRLADLPIWPGRDGKMRRLRELFLPADDALMNMDLAGRVIHQDLLDDPKLGGTATRALRELFGVEVLDTTEEVVRACESPPSDTAELLELLSELTGHQRSLSDQQRRRLRHAAFVPCRDRGRRRPAEVIVGRQPLPPPLENERAAEEVVEDRRLTQLLASLGARPHPTGDQLAAAARQLDGRPVRDVSADPAHLLWEYLDGTTEHDGDLHLLAGIAWMVAAGPGAQRRTPRDLIDPALKFATLRHAIPAGVPSPREAMREGLGIRARLSPTEYVALARAAAERQHRLDSRFLSHLERLAADTANHATLRPLKDVAFFPVADRLCAPADFVSRSRAALWGHLKRQLDAESVRAYPRILSLWGVAGDDDEIPWHEHLDVLEALAALDNLNEPDRDLARLRIRSLARLCEEDEARLVGLDRKPCALTSGGLVVPGAAFHADLPTPIVARVRPHLAVVDETDQEERRFYQLLRQKQIGVASLRESVELTCQTGRRTREATWDQRLTIHANNVYRFFHHSVTLLDLEPQRWPPRVERTPSLIARVGLGGREIACWEAKAFLEDQGQRLCLLVLSDAGALEDLVDALSAHFGIEAGRKSLLLSVLGSSTAEDGAQRLDWDEIPELPRALQLVLRPPESIDALPEPEVNGSGDEVADDPVGADEEQPAPRRELPSTPPRPQTNWERLIRKGYQPRPVADPQVPDRDRGEETPDGQIREPSTIVLSFLDVQEGCLPIRRAHVRRLAGGVPLREVLIFGERHPATERDQTTVRIEGGRELFAHREMVPGTVVHLLPGHQGMIELAVHEDEHEVRDVWMLSVDDHGQLHRYRADAVTVRYETDGPLYKAERRWEDHPALHAEAKNSAIELIIDAFERFGADGMSTQEVWDAVALHRLFALSTISTRLSEQKRLFERRGDRWFLTGDKTILQPQGPAPDVPLDRLLRPLERFLATFPEFRYKVAARLGFRLPEGSTDRELVRQHGPGPRPVEWWK